LIAKEAGLVPFLETDPKTSAELGDNDFIGQSRRPHRLGLKSLLTVRLRWNLNKRMLRAQNASQTLKQCLRSLKHRQAENLGRKDIIVSIDDQARETVGFGVYHATGIAHGVEIQHVASQFDGTLHFLFPKFESGGRGPERQHPHGNFGARVVQAVSEEFSLGSLDGHQITGTGCRIDGANEFPEQVRVNANRAQSHSGQRPVGRQVKRSLLQQQVGGSSDI
jgi:hypothetical protein